MTDTTNSALPALPEQPDDGELEAWRKTADDLLICPQPSSTTIRRAAHFLQNAYLFASKLPDLRAALAAQPAPVFDAEGFRAWIVRNLPDDTIIGSGQWWADHLTEWARRFVKEAAQPAPVAPMEMALCERHSLVLRVGQPYVFRPVGDCESCAKLAAAARDAYGPDMGAPAPVAPAPQSLGAPASPSGSPLQPAVSAAIPGASVPFAGIGWRILNEGEPLQPGDGFLHPSCGWTDFVCRPDMFRGANERAHTWPWRRRADSARGIESEGREPAGPSPKCDEPGPAGTRPEDTSLLMQAVEALNLAVTIIGHPDDEGSKIIAAALTALRARLAAAPAGMVPLPPAYMLAKLQMVMPLFQEARDALTAINEVQRKANGISPTLADRMDEAGTFSLDDWQRAHGIAAPAAKG